MFLADSLRSKSIRTYCKLHYLNVGWNRLVDVGGNAILNAAVEATRLHTLILCFNGLTDNCASGISYLLERNRSLTYFDLSYNKLGHESAMAIAEGVVRCPSMQHMLIGFNPLGYEGCTAIIQNLVHASSALRFLGLENCTLDGPNCDVQLQTLFDAVYITNAARKKTKSVIKVPVEFPPQQREFSNSTEQNQVRIRVNLAHIPFLFEGRAVETDSQSIVNTTVVKKAAMHSDMKLINLLPFLERNGCGGAASLPMLEEVLSVYYSFIVDVFTYYALRSGGVNSCLRLVAGAMTCLMTDTNTPDVMLRIADIDTIFIQTYRYASCTI